MDKKTDGLGRQIAKGAGWMVFMRFSIRLIGFASTIVLARLLVPEDFGLVVLATMFAGLLEVVAEFRFAIYLITKQDTERSHYDTAWTLTIIRGILLAIALSASAYYASRFFEKPELEGIIYCLAGAVIIEGLANIGIVDFQKSLQFDREFRFKLYGKLTSFVVTLVLAFLLRNYWALVIGIITGKLTRTMLSYRMHPYRPRIDLSRTAEILKFSKWMVFNQILAFVSKRADVFVIGKYSGAGPLGLFSVGLEIAMLASSQLVMPIHRALLPGYAKLAPDLEAMRRAYAEALGLIVMLALPIAAGIAVAAEPFVALVLGPKWAGAVALIQVLAIASIMQIFRANTHPLLIAIGKPQLTTLLAAVVAASVIPLLLWWTPSLGAHGAAWAVSISAVVGAAANFLVVVIAAGIQPKSIILAIWRSLISTAIMSVAVNEAIRSSPVQEAGVVMTLCTAVFIGIVTYVGTQLLLWYAVGKPDGSERHVITAVESAMSGRRAA